MERKSEVLLLGSISISESRSEYKAVCYGYFILLRERVRSEDFPVLESEGKF